MSELLTCRRCGGIGTISYERNATPVVCPDCNGEGLVRVYPANVEMVPRAALVYLLREVCEFDSADEIEDRIENALHAPQVRAALAAAEEDAT